MEWREVRIVVQNECLSIKSRIEALDGDRQPLVNERCFAAVAITITIFIERTNSSKLQSEAPSLLALRYTTADNHCIDKRYE